MMKEEKVRNKSNYKYLIGGHEPEVICETSMYDMNQTSMISLSYQTYVSENDPCHHVMRVFTLELVLHTPISSWQCYCFLICPRKYYLHMNSQVETYI